MSTVSAPPMHLCLSAPQTCCDPCHPAQGLMERGSAWARGLGLAGQAAYLPANAGGATALPRLLATYPGRVALVAVQVVAIMGAGGCAV